MSSKKTVLIIDDEESILFSLQRVLELSGEYEVVACDSATVALEKLNDFLPDLIISDIHMPDIDGIEFCSKIRQGELTKNIPFIFLTAKKEMMIEGIKAGGDDFIMKPFTFDEVLVKIEAIFRRIKNTKEQVSQIKGKLNENGLDKIIQICHEKSISGDLLLQKAGEIGEIKLDRGEITSAKYNNLKDDKALDVLRQWKNGIFVIRPVGMKLRPEFLLSRTDEDALIDMDGPVELAKDTWWVGYRNKNTMLQLNVYLRRFRDKGRVINFLVDPGSPIDFPIVSRKIAKIISNIANINLYSLNHQDPDVCMSAVFIRNANPKAICMTTEENWRLITHYEINPQSVKIINTLKDWQVKLATGHRLKFLPSPFCHAKGSFMIYDLETRILYTGDLFGGISESDRLFVLFAEEEDWDGIRAFHQIYMPANSALRHAIEQIRNLDPPPLMIAPQHGAILRGELMDRFLERIYHLDVGADLLNMAETDDLLLSYRDACNELLEFSSSLINMTKINQRIKMHPYILPLCEFKDGRVKTIFSKPSRVYEQITMALITDENVHTVNQIKTFALKISQSKGLPPPLLDWDSDQTLSDVPEQLFDQ
ncbi:MAG TPA: response regulator [Caldithrix abyssi]|uniref:Response regulator n=1 Tax=Caldithrix abyssi TaxID=187145 RepID=A0A7V4WV57_CALAY|nr:response regulator [Caldithrix abyssi]